ncbi:helix-turn-helix domain-containing protein [Microbacterium testaceum]|uniref:helix-turn-helix domain-containing protein n=1 Tax=Microbacterium testaceum TaxID=2033 RepID=UPI001D16FC79|nr:helix-turn-helix transcriptional regulator [Microbacterium testaceum]MCC4250219.1 helix-turn-helix domain-containing protein [Microbacterium testaceum]
MASGKEPDVVGLAQDVARYVQRRIVDLGWSYDHVARAIGMSKGYTAKRVTGAAAFTLRDFEMLARMFDLEPEELLARVQLPEASDYEGRLVPRYEVLSRRGEKVVYRTEDADPTTIDGNIIRGRFGSDVGAPTEDDLDAVARDTDPEPTDEQ